MLMPIVAVAGGLALLLWSAERFVEGSAATARHLGMSPLLIGMVVVGFGTSAPEMLVSALAAAQRNPELALGNAYGSNIANIGLILGASSLVSPLVVNSRLLRSELPIILAVTALTAFLLSDGGLSREDALILLGVFGALLAWTIWQGLHRRDDALAAEMVQELAGATMPLKRALALLGLGLILLLASSRALVWGAEALARAWGVSDLLIGLTVVAVGTSLPELASSLTAARKGEHDIAIGNVLGSNLFNTLAVVGIAGVIHPITVDPVVLTRDVPVMAAFTVSLLVMGYGFGRQGRINRWEASILLTAYVGYNVWLATTALGP